MFARRGDPVIVESDEVTATRRSRVTNRGLVLSWAVLEPYCV